MNIFKKLFSKFTKKDKNENSPWYNDKTNTYDPKTGTPNGEAYISPESTVIGMSNHISSK